MELTTLCYLERGDEYLMLHRISKKDDINDVYLRGTAAGIYVPLYG